MTWLSDNFTRKTLPRMWDVPGSALCSCSNTFQHLQLNTLTSWRNHGNKGYGHSGGHSNGYNPHTIKMDTLMLIGTITSALILILSKTSYGPQLSFLSLHSRKLRTRGGSGTSAFSRNWPLCCDREQTGTKRWTINTETSLHLNNSTAYIQMSLGNTMHLPTVCSSLPWKLALSTQTANWFL